MPFVTEKRGRDLVKRERCGRTENGKVVIVICYCAYTRTDAEKIFFAFKRNT